MIKSTRLISASLIIASTSMSAGYGERRAASCSVEAFFTPYGNPEGPVKSEERPRAPESSALEVGFFKFGMRLMMNKNRNVDF